MKKGFFTIVLIFCIISVFSAVTIYYSGSKSLNITLLNDSTQALDDSFIMDEDAVLNDSVSGNDTISTDGGNFWSVVTGPVNGIFSLDSNGTFVYTPNLNYYGADTITYQLCDIDGDCDTAQIFIVINPVNDNPVAVADSATTIEDTPQTINVPSNDTDIDGNIDLTTVAIVTAPLHGTTAVDNLTGIITYTPDANYYGNDTFKYSIGDDGTPLPAKYDTASVFVTITPVNDAGLPIANNDYAYTTSYTPVTISVLYNDNFGDVPCSCAITATNGTHGTTSINNNSTPANPTDDKVIYTANAAYHGPDSFTYTITDIDGEVSTATVFVDVTSMFAPTLTDPANNAMGQMPDVFLSWTAVPGAFHYLAQLSTDSLFTTVINYYTDMSATNADQLFFNTKYYWRVKAYNNSVTDSSGWSDIKKFNVVKTVTITKPANNAQNRNVEMYFKWNAISGLTNYEYQIDSSLLFTSPLFVSKIVAFNKVETYSKELAFNTNYYLRMRAIHESDTSEWSDVRNFQTLDTFSLRSPANSAINVSPAINLEWNGLGSSQYEYAIATDSLYSDGVYKVIDSTYHTIIITTAPKDTIIRDNPDTLDFGQTYYWKARGVNTFGNSQWTNTWKFTTVDQVTLVAPANNAVDVDVMTVFEWVKIANIIRYEMRLDVSPSFSNPDIYSYNGNYMPEDTIPGTQIIHYSDTMFNALQQNTTYYWSMRALTSVDTSAWSTTRMFTTKDLSGIENNLSNNNVSIYPNPSNNGKFNIQIPAIADQKINLSVINMVGQEIYGNVLHLKSGNNLFNINLQDKDNGIYFVRLQSEDITLTRKIILNR
ncbi:MAG TPA: Ig-like domain-containing protein [Bacteroidales bacterium]|nr:Ig-like domain-containing protein [Bacteroidales bacterium]